MRQPSAAPPRLTSEQARTPSSDPESHPVNPPSNLRTTPAWALACLLPLAAACTDAGDVDAGPQVTDSAGVAIVISGGDDRPAGAILVADYRLGGREDDVESFYEVGATTVSASPDGRIAVLDAANHRVLVFDSAGQHLRSHGRQGDGPGELAWPISVFWDDAGRVVVQDIGKRGLQAWDEAGDPAEAPSLSEDLFGWRIAGDGRGFLVAGRKSSGEERFLLRVEGGVADTLVTLASPETVAIQLESCGMGFSGMTPLFAPTLRWGAGGDAVAVAPSAGYVVDLYRDGRRVRSVRRAVEPQPATLELAEAEVGDAMRVMTSAGERVCDTEEVAEKRGFAEVVPVVRRVAVAPDGTLWVERWAVGEALGPIDLFDGEGAYRGTLAAGSPFPLDFLPDGRVLWSETDDFDVERLVVGRVEWTAPGTD